VQRNERINESDLDGLKPDIPIMRFDRNALKPHFSTLGSDPDTLGPSFPIMQFDPAALRLMLPIIGFNRCLRLDSVPHWSGHFLMLCLIEMIAWITGGYLDKISRDLNVNEG
jgi:hypothetical protein